MRVIHNFRFVLPCLIVETNLPDKIFGSEKRDIIVTGFQVSRFINPASSGFIEPSNLLAQEPVDIIISGCKDFEIRLLFGL